MPDAHRRSRSLLGIVVVLIVIGAIGSVTTNTYYLTILTLALIWSILGVSWNILGGYAGQVSFGHAAFFGLGSMTVAWLQARFDVTPLLGLPGGILVATIAGYLIGRVCFRLQGTYFSLAMLVFPFVLMNLLEWLGLHELTLPLKRIDAGWYLQFADRRVMLAIALGALGIALLISHTIARSQFGVELRAIREDELAAEAAGVDTRRRKNGAMLASAAIAGAAGGLYTLLIGVVTPQGVFGPLTSAQIIVVTLFGGVGSLWGPVVGAMILIPLSELLYASLGSAVPGIQGLVYGVAIIATVLLAPEGLLWRLDDLRARRADRRIVLVRPPLPDAGMARARPPAGSPILQVAGVSRSFGGLRAVADVSFEVPEAAITGIIGPNGAGKSTLFNLLNGITRPDAGTITFRGKGLVGLLPHEVCRLGIGRTFQVPRLLPRLTLLENVMVSAGAAPPGGAPPAALAAAALAQVGLGEAGHLPAADLSTRDARLLELARALASQPKLLLLDEPFAGLGQAETADLVRIVRELPALGLAVVIIEHTMHAMMQLADHLIALDSGSVLAAGSPKAVVADPKVVAAYLGAAWGDAHADA